MSPQDILNFLNSYFKRMSIPIHEHNGFIDKFIGDAIMALYDRPNMNALDAVKSSIAMIEAIKVYNQHRSDVGHQPISIGIGLHTGEAIIGTVGAEDRMDSTVLGDAVNLASRIEGLTKYYNAQIIISSQTYRLLDDDSILSRKLDFVSVKGKKKPETIFEIFNGNENEMINKKVQILQPFHEGLINYYSRQWNDSIKLFEECLKIYPDDVVSKMYVDRCIYCQEFSPPDDWDGMLIMNQK